jgi:hypothetical protein
MFDSLLHAKEGEQLSYAVLQNVACIHEVQSVAAIPDSTTAALYTLRMILS